MKKILLGILFCFNAENWQTYAQTNTPAHPHHSAPRFVKIDFENDILQVRKNDARDGNFTNGVHLTMMGNFWKRLPTRFLLLEFTKADTANLMDFDDLYNFSVGQEMYTPREISVSSIQPEDRPYAGWLYASFGLTTVDVVRARKLTSSLNVGVMGPASQAAETQSTIHRWIDSPHPEGWKHQIRNAIGVNYAVRYEARPFPQFHRAFDFFGLLEGTAGTVTNYMGAGFTLRIGQFNNYFQNAVGLYDCKAYVDKEVNQKLYAQAREFMETKLKNLNTELENHDTTLKRRYRINKKAKRLTNFSKNEQFSNRKSQLYFFVRPVARIMLDNSFLQGGWRFRRDNPYTLDTEDITHFYVNVEYGSVFSIKSFQVAYTQSFRTKEFRFGEQQQWGRVSLLFGLN